MRCPICRKPVEPKSEMSPFCSERCRLIDLGNWALERYRIPARDTEADMQSEEGADDGEPRKR